MVAASNTVTATFTFGQMGLIDPDADFAEGDALECGLVITRKRVQRRGAKFDLRGTRGQMLELAAVFTAAQTSNHSARKAAIKKATSAAEA
jgi:hypothetical protein